MAMQAGRKDNDSFRRKFSLKFPAHHVGAGGAKRNRDRPATVLKFDGYRIQVHPRRQMTTPKKEHN